MSTYKISDEAIEAACDLTYAGKQLTPAHARLVLEYAFPHLREQVLQEVEGAIMRKLGITSRALRVVENLRMTRRGEQ
jgi:hypothetical protein